MNPANVIREGTSKLTDLPNIGKAMACDLRLLGIVEPHQIEGRCPLGMYRDLCLKTGRRHDPCVIDVFMSVASFVAGNEAEPWWHFTAERKRLLGTAPLHEDGRTGAMRP
ncbi:MAG: mitomycin resistance protein [Chlorobi bacterium]|nr:mitomycin resistance protein [Chlorobiota bacterium]